jgi:hypothetical protein
MIHKRGWSGLDVVFAFMLFATFMALFVGTSLLFPGKVLESLWRLNPEARTAFQSMGRLSSLLLFVVGAVAGGAAVGIGKRHKWGWWLAVLLFSVNMLGDAISLMRGRVWQGASGVLVSGYFIVYLLRPGVRRQFLRDANRAQLGASTHDN